MDAVTILNECAYVGYEIAEELGLRGYEVLYLPRERGLYSKTIGVLVNVLRSEGILHVNYALQDAYLVGKLKNSFLLHAHGSDLRWSIAGRWGWMVRSSLKAASKVIVATPDLLETAREYRADAEYLPNPVDTERFAPQSFRLQFIATQDLCMQYILRQSMSEEEAKLVRRDAAKRLSVLALRAAVRNPLFTVMIHSMIVRLSGKESVFFLVLVMQRAWNHLWKSTLRTGRVLTRRGSWRIASLSERESLPECLSLRLRCVFPHLSLGSANVAA